MKDSGTDMPPVLVISSGCQAGAYFDNEVIPPGVLRPKLPWSYTYAQFDALLASLPGRSPGGFFNLWYTPGAAASGLLQRVERGHQRAVTHCRGKKTLANELSVIIHRIQRLKRDDPIWATEETALLDVEGAPQVGRAPGRWILRHTRGPSGPVGSYNSAGLIRGPA